MEKLYGYFLQAGFTAADATHIAASFSFKQLAKGDYFVEEGKTSKHLGFVVSGFLQYFCYYTW